MSKLSVTVLSGFVGAGKSAVRDHLLKHSPNRRIAVLVNQRQGEEARQELVQEKLVTLSEGCICCTLREDLLREVDRLARSGRYDSLLIESTGITEPLPIAETFAYTDDRGKSLSAVARLDTLATVIDAERFWKDYTEAEYLHERGLTLDDEDDRTVADLLINQIEFCNVLIINKIDRISAEEVARLEAILRHLNPEAEILHSTHGEVAPDQILDTHRFDLEATAQAAGWLKEARGEHLPDSPAQGIHSFVYRAKRPFHPGRFWALLTEGDWTRVVRSRGFFWLASRMEVSGLWSQAGGACEVEPAGLWLAAQPEEEWGADPDIRAEVEKIWDPHWGDRRQELAFLVCDLDESVLRTALDACLLTDEELAQGPAVWQTYPDSFGHWHVESHEE